MQDFGDFTNFLYKNCAILSFKKGDSLQKKRKDKEKDDQNEIKFENHGNFPAEEKREEKECKKKKGNRGRKGDLERIGRGGGKGRNPI